MCFVEIYAAGPEGVAVVERTLDTFEKFGMGLFEEIPGREAMPSQMIRAMIGGLQKVVHKRLYRDEEAELVDLAPQIWKWWLSYPPPPGPLRTAAAALAEGARPSTSARRSPTRPSGCCGRWRRSSPRRAIPATTVAEVVDRASTSQRTFYEHFANKEDALLAALDSGSAQMLATVLPAFRRAPSWEESVKGAYEAMFGFGTEEPEYTLLGAVEMYAAGKRALQTRDTIMEGLEALLAPGYELAPETPEIAAEAIGGAIYALIYDQVKAKGPESMPELVPMADLHDPGAVPRRRGRLRARQQLIWPSICQVPNHQRPAEAGLFLGPGGGGRPGARRAVRLICAGWLPQDRVSSQRPLSRIERRRGAAAHSCFADALARRAEPAASWAKRCSVGQSTVATAQQKPLSSRATATAQRVRRLPRSESRRTQLR